jgi:hypothetical protein
MLICKQNLIIIKFRMYRKNIFQPEIKINISKDKHLLQQSIRQIENLKIINILRHKCLIILENIQIKLNTSADSLMILLHYSLKPLQEKQKNHILILFPIQLI